MKNFHEKRDSFRAEASKNCMWYDLDRVKKSFDDAIKDLVQTVNNIRNGIKVRARACAFLKVADHIETHHIISLKEAYSIYRKEFHRELLFYHLSHVLGIARTIVETILDCFTVFDDFTCLKNNEQLQLEKQFGKETTSKIVSFLLKLPKMKYISSDARDLLMNHLPVIIVYKQIEDNNTQAFVVKKLKGVEWGKMVGELDWPVFETKFRQTFDAKLKTLIPSALKYCTEKDRHLLKLILVKLTSKTYLTKSGIGDRKFDRTYLEHDSILAQKSLQDWMEMSGHEKKKSKFSGNRLPGSGRLLLSEKYPELTKLMLRIFDSQEGLQYHPRLACETLYLYNNHDYVDMPRCVTILQEVYGIDISLSAAYTYTETFRSKTKQAARHHEGKGVNPCISLRKPTKDGAAHDISINDHYSQTDVNYALEEGFASKAIIIARDDKALVHTDVQVVERPSKSWYKIAYADHDWAKDTQRSLQITTYQFVEMKEKPQNDNIYLGEVPVCQTNLTGPGLSLVKIHQFEGSTVFRHFNELLFVLTVEKFEKFFVDSNGDLLSQILLTVDGGPDERPRNKMTKFACVLMKRLLDLDKIKTTSYAEGSSKRHSVERYHVVEGRALSQQGTISSHAIYDKETDDQGLFDEEKFKENMEHARLDCIRRIDNAPYAGSTMTALKPPPECDWIISVQDVNKIEQFLKTDSTEYRLRHNFVIKPQGPLWEKLCDKYKLSRTKAFHAISVFDESNDPFCSWQQHYGFSSFRRDDAFRGNMFPFRHVGIPYKRIELQPIIDVGKLPEFHYLPYSQVVQMLKYFVEKSMDLPTFLDCPDYYLPSKNIDFYMENAEQTDNTNLEHLQNLIGVSIQNIQKYIHQKKEKEELAKKRKAVKDSYQGTPLGQLTIVELKQYLEKHHVSFTREQNNKADLLVLLDRVVKKSGLSQDEFLND